MTNQTKSGDREKMGHGLCRAAYEQTLDGQFLLAGSATFHDYHTAYNEAVKFARYRGKDVGLEKADEFGRTIFNVFSLPKPEHRCGYELRCEVVSPESPFTP